jgi:hypothetical protein
MQLQSYIAPAAPATRRPFVEPAAFLRPEFGFTPQWYRRALGIDFGRRWHEDVEYRRDSREKMQAELQRRFPGLAIGQLPGEDASPDLLTGLFGGCTLAGVYGTPILFYEDNWPNCDHVFLSEQEITNLHPPDLDSNPVFNAIMEQCDVIEAATGRIEGFINWQGVLNTAQRLRGEALFADLAMKPDLARHLFSCVSDTMIQAAKRLHRRQAESGVHVHFFTVSNCLVNMISPQHYREFLLPHDTRIAENFGCMGIHNCAWKADPYLDLYAQIPNLGYIDMGLHSDLRRARELFPHCRRALMYTPMDLANNSMTTVRDDLHRVADEYGPCDIVIADIEAGTPDERILAVAEECGKYESESTRK